MDLRDWLVDWCQSKQALKSLASYSHYIGLIPYMFTCLLIKQYKQL